MLNSLFNKPIKEVFSHLPIQVSYFFGSQRTSFIDKDSDYDIAVFVEDKRKTNIENLLRNIVQYFSFPEKFHLSIVDIHNTSPVFLYQIIRNGELIYKQENFDQTELEARIMHLYFDDSHRKNIYFHYLKRKYANR